MNDRMTPSYDQIRELLTSDQVAAADDEIAALVGSSVIRAHPPSPEQLRRLLAETSVAGFGPEELLAELGRHRHMLPRFAAAVIRGEASHQREEEYGPCGPPDDDDDDPHEVHLGYAPGTSITHLIYVIYLERGDHGALTDYLKRRRIPKAREFARRLRQAFRSTEHTTET